MPEGRVLCLAKIGILSHGLVNVYGNVLVSSAQCRIMSALIHNNVQILSGKQPFLTKGPFAMFFGGDDILSELSDKKSGKHLPLLYLVSTLFSITITGR